MQPDTFQCTQLLSNANQIHADAFNVPKACKHMQNARKFIQMHLNAIERIQMRSLHATRKWTHVDTNASS